MHRRAIFAEAGRLTHRDSAPAPDALRLPPRAICERTARQTRLWETRSFTPSSASCRCCEARLPHLNRTLGLIACGNPASAMAARVTIPIDNDHARAICDEIGERLRIWLKRDMPTRLPPRFQQLIEQLAATDHDVAPSIVPSLDDISDSVAPTPAS